MTTMRFDSIPVPEKLKEDVECFRIFEYTGEEELAIKISPIAMPGIVFQHKNGQSAIENLLTPSGRNLSVPTSFIYGPGIEPSVMNYKMGHYITILVILKPHALKTLLGVNAATMTNRMIELNEFSTGDINSQLVEVNSEKKSIALLVNFLIGKRKQAKMRDELVQEGLRLIHNNIAHINVKYLLEDLNISERQFEKRFTETVGISPQSYIRVKRFNEAIRLMKTKQFERLTDVAHALNFYDQSHFIRDLKEFSGITPKSIFQKVDNFHDQGGFSYV